MCYLAKPPTTHDYSVVHLSCENEVYDTEGREGVRSTRMASPFVSFRDSGKVRPICAWNFGTLNLPTVNRTAVR